MNTARREFLQKAGAAVASSGVFPFVAGCGNTERTPDKRRPNVILILTDDQGYGDLGCHGNKIIKTPNLDRFAAENVEFTRFYVCPTCAPTRAGLMTGRYHHRTGIMGVMSGEALIHPGEVTMAEVFGEAGYRTGIFGKWHLGDNYPRRPDDMGFQESLIHNGGGLSQPSDPPGKGYLNSELHEKYYFVVPDRFPHWVNSNTYFDPILRHNGEPEQYEGYCTDIFFDSAIEFIEKNRSEPFFIYLPTNAPHSPEIIGEDYLKPYRDMGLDDKTARCYAMITNIDDNFARLRSKLRELDIEENTILIFMGDNGPQYLRFNSGLRARKSHFYEGGIRAPFIISWPEKLTTAGKIENIAANIDMFPTLLSACGIGKPDGISIDGTNLMPLIKRSAADWPERTLFLQGNDGVPELYNKCAVITQRYKLVNGSELYDLIDDHSEKNNIAGEFPGQVAKMREQYEAWFEDVGSTRGYEPQRIYIGTQHENPVILTSQDWRGPRSRFIRKDSLGYWEVDVRNAGTYEITLRFKELETPLRAHFSIGSISENADLKKGETSHTFGPFDFEAGEARLEAWLELRGETFGVDYVDVKRV